MTDEIYRDKAQAHEDILNNLIEGGTSYFTENVWNSVFPAKISTDELFRQDIEGSQLPYDEKSIPVWEDGYTGERDYVKNKLVAVYGETNMAAAFFQGKTDKIGL